MAAGHIAEALARAGYLKPVVDVINQYSQEKKKQNLMQLYAEAQQKARDNIQNLTAPKQATQNTALTNGIGAVQSAQAVGSNISNGAAAEGGGFDALLSGYPKANLSTPKDKPNDFSALPNDYGTNPNAATIPGQAIAKPVTIQDAQQPSAQLPITEGIQPNYHERQQALAMIQAKYLDDLGEAEAQYGDPGKAEQHRQNAFASLIAANSPQKPEYQKVNEGDKIYQQMPDGTFKEVAGVPKKETPHYFSTTTNNPDGTVTVRQYERKNGETNLINEDESAAEKVKGTGGGVGNTEKGAPDNLYGKAVAAVQEVKNFKQNAVWVPEANGIPGHYKVFNANGTPIVDKEGKDVAYSQESFDKMKEGLKTDRLSTVEELLHQRGLSGSKEQIRTQYNLTKKGNPKATWEDAINLISTKNKLSSDDKNALQLYFQLTTL